MLSVLRRPQHSSTSPKSSPVYLRLIVRLNAFTAEPQLWINLDFLLFGLLHTAGLCLPPIGSVLHSVRFKGSPCVTLSLRAILQRPVNEASSLSLSADRAVGRGTKTELLCVDKYSTLDIRDDGSLG